MLGANAMMLLTRQSSGLLHCSCFRLGGCRATWRGCMHGCPSDRYLLKSKGP